MKWILVDNSSRTQPVAGSWPDWKEEIADSCSHQCVYCAIPEARYGGLDNYHVDHFRPKSINQFKHLENKITNLYLCCAICNRFKGKDWPGEPRPDLSTPSYPDPSVVDYCTVLAVGDIDDTVSGSKVATKYMVERLYLNRPQLVRERRLARCLSRLQAAVSSCKTVVAALQRRTSDPFVVDLLARISSRSLQVNEVLATALQTAPYKLPEVKKPSRRKAGRLGRKTTRQP